MRFYCACSEDPQGLLDYCEPHRFFRCHVERWNVPAAVRPDAEVGCSSETISVPIEGYADEG